MVVENLSQIFVFGNQENVVTLIAQLSGHGGDDVISFEAWFYENGNAGVTHDLQDALSPAG